jgi:hypothetical protein
LTTATKKRAFDTGAHSSVGKVGAIAGTTIWLTADETAERSRFCRVTIQRACRAGQIPGARKRNGRWRIPEWGLDAWMMEAPNGDGPHRYVSGARNQKRPNGFRELLDEH